MLAANDWDATRLDGTIWFVATYADEIVGVVQATDLGDGIGYLPDVVVTADRRGAGIGSGLMRTVIEDLGGEVWLVCHDERLAFYGRLGFERVEEPDAPRKARDYAYEADDLPSEKGHVHHMMRRP